MTIEEKVRNVFLELLQGWLEIILQAKRGEISDEARNIATMLKIDQAVHAILELIKPMSRERLMILITTSSLTQSGNWNSFEERQSRVNQLTDAILKEWENK